jgi:hypothetical protein
LQQVKCIVFGGFILAQVVRTFHSLRLNYYNIL